MDFDEEHKQPANVINARNAFSGNNRFSRAD